jgi:hypothetical protein
MPSPRQSRGRALPGSSLRDEPSPSSVHRGCACDGGYSSPVSNAAVDAAGAEDERFSGTSGRFFGWVGVAASVAMGLVAVTGDPVRDRKTLYLAVGLGAVCWVVLIRPSVSSNANGVVLRNMLRDTFIPWSKIDRCRVVQTLQIATEDAQHFHGLGVGRSARSMVKKSYGRSSLILPGILTGRVGRDLDMRSEAPARPMSQRIHEGVAYQDYVEHKISARARQSPADDLEPVVAWSLLPLAALAVAVVLLVLLIFT